MDRIWRNIVVAALGLAAVWYGTRSPAETIDFASSVEAARQTEATAAEAGPKPVVLTFSASWCGWCRKMATTTFADPQVLEISGDYLWVKVDPEDEPKLAAEMGVHGLPHTVLLNGDGQAIGAQPGYMPPEAFLQFLAESLANPQPIHGVSQSLLDDLANLDAAGDPAAAVRTAIEQVALPDNGSRDRIVSALRDAGTSVYPHLVTLLNDERLAVRAAAGVILQKATGKGLPFDPFADLETREAQTRQWAEWIRVDGVSSPT